jgi:hypothetical protein
MCFTCKKYLLNMYNVFTCLKHLIKLKNTFSCKKMYAKYVVRAKFNIYVSRKRRKKYLKNISDSFHRQNNTWKIWKIFLPVKIIWNILKMFLQAKINICETWKMFFTCRKISKKDSRRFYRQKKYLWNMKDV